LTCPAFREGGARPAFSLRLDRFQTAYAYPKPGTSLWYIGSSMVRQSTTRDRPGEAERALRRWHAIVEEATGGLVQAEVVSEPTQGWRPAPAPYDKGPFAREVSGVLCVRPMGASGVRLAPRVVDDVLATLNLR
jgi:hypothetical protein